MLGDELPTLAHKSPAALLRYGATLQRTLAILHCRRAALALLAEPHWWHAAAADPYATQGSNPGPADPS